MKQKKLYFRDIDSEFCKSLESHFEDAKDEGLERINLTEAIIDKSNPNYIWCGHFAEIGEKEECAKSKCSFYSSKSGRGVCKHRGNLYEHGEEVEFDIPKI